MVRTARPARSLRLGFVVALVLSSLISFTGARAQEGQPGTILIDTMDDPAGGLLVGESPDPSLYRFVYENGQYIIEAFAADHTGDLVAYLQTSPLDNMRLTIDVSLREPVQGRYALVGCRAGVNHDGYLFEVYPDAGAYRFWRMDAGQPAQLGETGFADAILPGRQVNTIGIECLDSLITGIVNGQPVGTVTDTTYLSGHSYIGAGSPADSAGPLYAAFDNLQVEVLGSLGLSPSPTPEPTTGPEPPLPPEPPAPTEQPPAPPEPPVPTEQPPLPPEPPVPTEPPPAPPDERTPIPPPSSPVQPDPSSAPAIEEALAVSQADPPAFGPISATATLVTGDRVAAFQSGVELIEFYASASFAVPEMPPNGSWQVGFCFWPSAQEGCPGLLVRGGNNEEEPSATWNFVNVVAPQLGDLAIDVHWEYSANPLNETGEGTHPLNSSPGTVNTIGLVVVDGSGHLLVNRQVVGSFALPVPPQRGDVELIAAYDSPRTDQAGGSPPVYRVIIPILEFAVWAIGDDRDGGAPPPPPAEPISAAAPTPLSPTPTPEVRTWGATTQRGSSN